MEFEKLRDIIVEVLNVDENEVTMESTFILSLIHILKGAEAAVKKAIELGIKELVIYYDYMGIEMWATGALSLIHI